MFTPQMMRLSIQSSMMLMEAQAVIAMRLMGMAGAWRVAPSENKRMVAEKSAAVVQSAMAAGRAMASGKRPEVVALAALKPVAAKTRANVARLARRGPGAPT